MLEHLVCSNVMAQFEEHNILNDRQHGFGKTQSCETQLVSIIHDWATSLEKRKQVDKFILDFEKAFDTVPRELLKSTSVWYTTQHLKLDWLRPGTMCSGEWFQVNTSKVQSGVPQGNPRANPLPNPHKQISENVKSNSRFCRWLRLLSRNRHCRRLPNTTRRHQ